MILSMEHLWYVSLDIFEPIHKSYQCNIAWFVVSNDFFKDTKREPMTYVLSKAVTELIAIF